MGVMSQILSLVIQTLASLYLTIVMVRFLLQMVRADFYNPISQFVVKATNPLLIPLRRLIPGVFGIDLASLVLALLIQWLALQLLFFVHGGGVIPPLAALLWSLVGLLSLALTIYFWSILIIVIASWLAPASHHPVLLLLRQLMEPVLAPFRRIIPPIGGFDISIIFAILVLRIIQILVANLGATLGAPTQLLGF